MAFHPIWCAYSDHEVDLHEHWHFGSEFIFITGGEADLTAAEKGYHVCAGQVLMIRRLVHHSTDRTFGETYGRYCLIVQPNELHKSPVGVRMMSNLTNADTESARLISADDDEEELRRLFATLEKECGGGEQYRQEYMLSVTAQLLTLLCRHLGQEEASAANQRIFRVREDIDRDFASPLSIAELAQRHFISEDHLIHEFKRVTGFSPGQYIILNRLAYAQELLTTTDYPVPVIAQRSGFHDVNNFIRSFRKQFGVPPGRFRRDNR